MALGHCAGKGISAGKLSTGRPEECRSKIQFTYAVGTSQLDGSGKSPGGYPAAAEVTDYCPVPDSPTLGGVTDTSVVIDSVPTCLPMALGVYVTVTVQELPT